MPKQYPMHRATCKCCGWKSSWTTSEMWGFCPSCQGGFEHTTSTITEIHEMARLAGPEEGSFYKHFRGGEYRVVRNVLRESDMEHLVVYECPVTGIAFSRPFCDWQQEVQLENQMVPRFKRVYFS